jgi:hypothetical protein
LVRDGLGAVETAHRDLFEASIRASFDDSLNFDEAMRPGHEQENRWDYLLGHASSGRVVAVEPHSAKQDEISTVVRKLAAAKEQVRPHLKDGINVSRWLWVASGNVQFAGTEKVVFQLAQKGIDFVGRRVLAKHLPQGATPSPRKRKRR